MSQDPIVRVVVGEAGEPHPGPVRWTLDIEGFDVVGQGSSRGELERVLAGVRPTVIVVDDAIPASALIALREKAPDAGVVVVWPASVSSKAIADAHVDPGCIEEDLARAVHRAARRSIAAVADPPVVVGEPVLILPGATLAPAISTIRSPAAPAVPRRSARVLLGTAAVLALIVMMVGVSFALDVTRRPGSRAGTSTTQAPTSSSSSSSVPPAGAAPVEVGETGQERPECGPRADPGSASSHAAQAPPGNNGDRGTRSRGADCGGANAGGPPHGGASGPGASHGHADGSGQGTDSDPTTDPVGHGHSGTHGGGHGHSNTGQTETDGDPSPGPGHSDGSSRTNEPASGGNGRATGH